MLNWSLHSNGSFDIVHNSLTITNCYPAIDGVAVRAHSVEVTETATGGVIHYLFSEASLEITLSRDSATLLLQTTLHGMTAAPHWVLPIGAGIITGADRFFRQGLGTSGPTLFSTLPLEKTAESHAITAILAPDDTTIVLYANDYHHYAMRALLTPEEGDTRPAHFEVGFASERIVTPAQKLALPDIRITVSPTPWDGLHAAAKEIGQAMGAQSSKPTAYHWCSWYYLYQHLTEATLNEYLHGFSLLDPPVPLQTIQIDAGYFPANGDWLETNWRWPSGIQAAAAKIVAAGYRPGIWIGPYMVGNRSRLYREHPDWVLRGLDDKPLAIWRDYGEYRVWGYPDEETYVLDTSHPDAMDYLRTVFRTLKSWGISYFKTDFILWGMQDSTKVLRHTPGKTSVEYVREFLEMIREEIGEESFWLACISPYAPFIGLADAMRIANDVSDKWGSGLPNVIRESVGDQYFNNIWWQNDPDAILLRDFHINMTDDEVRALACWQAVQGGVVNTSDPLHEISAERLALWRFLQPAPEHAIAHMPYWGQDRPLRLAVREYPALDAWGLVILNANDHPALGRFALAEIIGEEQAYLFSWEPGQAIPLGKDTSLLAELRAHATAIYFISRTETPPPPGLTLGGAIIDERALIGKR